jgi:hypothetical protein
MPREQIFIGAIVRLEYEIWKSHEQERCDTLPVLGTAVPFELKSPAGVVKSKTGYTGTTGIIYVDIGSSDFDEDGIWQVQAQILGSFTTIDEFRVFTPL